MQVAEGPKEGQEEVSAYQGDRRVLRGGAPTQVESPLTATAFPDLHTGHRGLPGRRGIQTCRHNRPSRLRWRQIRALSFTFTIFLIRKFA